LFEGLEWRFSKLELGASTKKKKRQFCYVLAFKTSVVAIERNSSGDRRSGGPVDRSVSQAQVKSGDHDDDFDFQTGLFSFHFELDRCLHRSCCLRHTNSMAAGSHHTFIAALNLRHNRRQELIGMFQFVNFSIPGPLRAMAWYSLAPSLH